MKKHALLAVMMAMGLWGCIGGALAAVEENYDPSKPPVTTPWFGRVGPAQQAADLSFTSGMRPHHAGALTMSEEYLKHPQARNGVLKQLARGIIHNQKFEMVMLDTVEGHMKKPLEGGAMRQVATKGLSQRYRFTRMPMPGPMDAWGSEKTVSAEDVRFAKAMIIHHEGALVMARDYLNDPAADNLYLRLMCLDILTDQAQEIAFMQAIINRYPGDPDSIIVTPDMVHGMEGMNHGHDGHKGHSSSYNGHAHHSHH